jgi:tRNA nucleotidyltransferase (CCA-adding enzyme)
VRDLLQGRPPRELDVVVDGDIEPLLDALGGQRVLHDRFATASVTLDGARVDVARARRERYAHPGALPEVEPAPLAEDLLRRDFTINAIAVRLTDGAVSAVDNAHRDLAAGQVRVLHDRSFIDDPTRLLRLARYAARLGFTIEAHTAALAHGAVGAGALATVSGARAGAELRLALAEAHPVKALAELQRLGLLGALGLPAAISPAALEAALAQLPADGSREALLLAALLGDGPSGAAAAALLDGLQVPAPVRDRAVATAAALQSLPHRLAACHRPSELRAVAVATSVEAITLVAALAPGSAAAQAATRWLVELRAVALQISGDDLIAAGMSEGPEIGKGLQRALDRRLDGELAAGRQAELAAALEGA